MKLLDVSGPSSIFRPKLIPTQTHPLGKDLPKMPHPFQEESNEPTTALPRPFGPSSSGLFEPQLGQMGGHLGEHLECSSMDMEQSGASLWEAGAQAR